MNLETMTDAQRTSVTRVNGPLLLCAGAGSGKTFTLQQRIAFALSPGSGPAASSIDEILAITFTDKAASEIKSRVRSVLREEGMFEEALRVDAAWISTIHGMCSRILREHALELGLDPAFVQLDEVQADELLACAISLVLERARVEEGGRYQPLFIEYGVSDGSDNSVSGLVGRILGRAAQLTDGLDAFDLGPSASVRPSSTARKVLLAYEDILDCSPAAKQGQDTRDAIELLEEYLGSPAAADPSDWASLESVLLALPKPGARGNAKDACIEAQTMLDWAFLELNLAKGAKLAGLLLTLAREVEATYDQLKREAGAIDMSDLLRLGLRALTQHDEIASQYRDRFKLVMVDEFQDTNQLQIDLIKVMCGPNLERLCTVGDSQQSIYRFLGADVNVYMQHKKDMASDEVGALCLQLDQNFRSHPDILSFVRKVCGQKGFFVEEFLDLTPGRDEDKVVEKGAHFRGEGSRIRVQMTSYGGGAAKVAEARRAEAEGIARWFAELREAGHKPGEMVVLMGSMTHAGPYAQALREAGFSCVVAGGSGFYDAPEVKLVGQLLRALANKDDSEALFAVLSNEMLMLSADDFVQLATWFPKEDDPRIKQRCAIGRKMASAQPEGASERLKFASTVLRRAWESLGVRRPSSIVRGVLEDSGWLMRLSEQGADGQAKAANVLKAVRIIEDLEAADGFDMARVSRKFSQMESKKEKMGALVGDASDSVRLMTVHSSKGLEFPLVAVVDCYKVKENNERLELLTLHGKAYMSLMPSENEVASTVASKYSYLKLRGEDLQASALDLAGLVETAATPADFKLALLSHRKREALYEKRRLFYVAATRASEAMMIGCILHVTKSGTMEAVQEDIQRALFGFEGFPGENALVEYRGTRPLEYEYVDADWYLAECERAAAAKAAGEAAGEAAGTEGLLADALEGAGAVVPGGAEVADGAEAAGGDGETPAGEEPREVRMAYPVLAERERPRVILMPEEKTDLFSYSSIADEKPVATTATREERAARAADPDKATELGSAFHRLAQLDVLEGVEVARASVDRMARTFGLVDVERLRAAFELWVASDLHAEAMAASIREPEMPFCVPLDGLFLEGEMDLFCANDEEEALVIDYKTGGFASEEADGLVRKHELQAWCYALAVLEQGFRRVKLHFVRVEHADAARAGQPQVVTYEFEQSAFAQLCENVLKM